VRIEEHKKAVRKVKHKNQNLLNTFGVLKVTIPHCGTKLRLKTENDFGKREN